MKKFFPFLRVVPALIFLCFSTVSARADLYRWNGAGGTPNWSTDANWIDGVRPVSNNFDTAIAFTGTDQLITQQDIAAVFQLNALRFTPNAGAFVINGGTLEFRQSPVNSSAYASINMNALSAINVNNTIILDTTITINGSGNGSLTLNGPISGAGGLTKGDSYSLYLKNVNTYTGPTTISVGMLQAAMPGSLPGYNVAGKVTVVGNDLGILGINVGGAGEWTAGDVDTLRANVNFQADSQLVFDTTNAPASGFTYNSAITENIRVTKRGPGTLTLGGANTYVGDTGVYGGTLALTSGSISNSIVRVGANGTLSVSGTGSINSGPSKGISISGFNNLVAAGSLSGNGQITTAGANIGSGFFNQSGGVFTVSGFFAVGDQAGGNSAYTLSGGSLSTANSSVGAGYNASVFTQSGGTHTTGTLTLGTTNGLTGGTYNLEGGVLAANNVVRANYFGNVAIVNFNGGTLQARQNSTAFLQGLTTANVRPGGAVIDSNGYAITIAQPLLHDSTANAPALDGGLIKANSANRLTLSATNTYTGPTRINGGTLALENSPGAATPTAGRLSATSGVLVNRGGTLLLSGSNAVTDRIINTAPVTLASGGSFFTTGLSEGSSAAGSAAGIGLLTLMGGSDIDFRAGTNGSTILAASGIIGGSGTISISHWSGTPGSDAGTAGNDRLLFVTDPNFTPEQLAQFQFFGDDSFAVGAGAMELAYNGFTEIVPITAVPEPATWLAGMLLVIAAGAAIRRQPWVPG